MQPPQARRGRSSLPTPHQGVTDHHLDSHRTDTGSHEAPRGTRGMPGQLGPRGQAVTEFALVLPVMLLFLLLTVDFGRLFFSYIAVNNAAREATYYAATHAA